MNQKNIKFFYLIINKIFKWNQASYLNSILITNTNYQLGTKNENQNIINLSRIISRNPFVNGDPRTSKSPSNFSELSLISNPNRRIISPLKTKKTKRLDPLQRQYQIKKNAYIEPPQTKFLLPSYSENHLTKSYRKRNGKLYFLWKVFEIRW